MSETKPEGEKLKNDSPSFAGQLGGARPGAGRPKGKKNKETLEIDAARRALRQRIMRNLEPIITAQLALAKGISYVYRIEKTYDKKDKLTKVEHVLVEDPYEIKEFLDEHEGMNGVVGEDYYYITTKAPDNRALDSLIDRLFGKARQNVGLDGGEDNKPIQVRSILNRLEGIVEEQEDEE